MKIANNTESILRIRNSEEMRDTKIGFVPTMGALHQGHVSLVKMSVLENDITIVSIFVNPRQFNNNDDFKKYPVTYEKDIKLLEEAGCSIVFVPQNSDIYNNYDGVDVDFGGLDKLYEGEFRPGHFKGVVDIVYRLFDLIKPTKAYFGQKDFQQLAIVKRLVEYKGLNVDIVSCPIVREKSGLAMSSRNELLSSQQRENASVIYQTMKMIKEKIQIGDFTSEYTSLFHDEIKKIPEMEPEYCVFCHPETLKEIKKIKKNTVFVMCVAVWCAKVRLIDNIILEF